MEEEHDISKHFNWNDAYLMNPFNDEYNRYYSGRAVIETIKDTFPFSKYHLLPDEVGGPYYYEDEDYALTLGRKITDRNLKNATDAMKISYLGLLWDSDKYRVRKEIKDKKRFSNMCDFFNISECEFFEYVKSGINKPLPSIYDIEEFLNTGDTKRKSDILKMKDIGSVVINDYNTLRMLMKFSSEKINENEKLISLYNDRLLSMEEDMNELNMTLSGRNSEHFEIFETGENLWKDIDKQVRLEGTKAVIKQYEYEIRDIKGEVGKLESYQQGWKTGKDKIETYARKLELDLKHLEKENSCWVCVRPYPDDRYWSLDQWNKICELSKEVSLTYDPGEDLWKHIIDKLCEL